MDVKTADAQLRHYAATLATLRNARKAIEAGPQVGIAAIDEAIAAHEKGAQAFVEEIAAEDWWDVRDIPALAGLIPLAANLVGVADDGPVVRLAVKVGEMCRPYDERRRA